MFGIRGEHLGPIQQSSEKEEMREVYAIPLAGKKRQEKKHLWLTASEPAPYSDVQKFDPLKTMKYDINADLADPSLGKITKDRLFAQYRKRVNFLSLHMADSWQDLAAKGEVVGEVGNPEKSIMPDKYRYAKLKLLGEGGMGKAYLALDGKTQLPVVIKFTKINKGKAKDREYLDRVRETFKEEIQLTASASDPHWVGVQSAFEFEPGQFALVMEHVRGKNIFRYFNELTVENMQILETTVAKLVIQILSALRTMHELGIIHHDIKSDNIMVTKLNDKPFVKVLDFGIARILSRVVNSRGKFGKLSEKGSKELFERSENFAVAEEGGAMGTPEYLPPEVVELGTNPDRTDDGEKKLDTYSVGVVMYELLCKKEPFRSDKKDTDERIMEISRKQSEFRFSPIGETILDNSYMVDTSDANCVLEPIVYALMSRDPSKRIADVDEIMELIFGAIFSKYHLFDDPELNKLLIETVGTRKTPEYLADKFEDWLIESKLEESK